MRQQCVELFMLEGYDIPAIAQILQRNERTIKRDHKDILDKNKEHRDPEFMDRQVSDMMMKYKTHYAHLMKLARSKNAKVSERTQAVFSAHRVSMETIEKLQSLGYLPSQAHEIIGDFYHHIDDKSVDTLSAQVIEMEDLISQTGGVPAIVQEEMKKAKALTHKMTSAKAEKPKEDKDEAK
jgi:hypothetical protein